MNLQNRVQVECVAAVPCVYVTFFFQLFSSYVVVRIRFNLFENCFSLLFLGTDK